MGSEPDFSDIKCLMFVLLGIFTFFIAGKIIIITNNGVVALIVFFTSIIIFIIFPIYYFFKFYIIGDEKISNCIKTKIKKGFYVIKLLINKL